MRFEPWTLAACAALWLLATGGPAAACSESDDCSEDECTWRPDFSVLRPSVGAEAVPPDAAVLLWWSDTSYGMDYWNLDYREPWTLALLDEAGEEVPFETERIGAWRHQLMRLMPRAPLTPGASYAVSAPPNVRSGWEPEVECDEPLGQPVVLRTFVVGDALAPPPPEPADLELVSTEVEGEVSDACEGDSRPYQEAVVRLTSRQPVVLVRDPERDGDGDGYADITAINLVPNAGSVELSLGSSGSDVFLSGAGDFQWGGAEPGARSQLQAATFDDAGRFSGWGEPLVVLMPIRGWSCGFAPGSDGLLPLLLFPLLRRRRIKPG